jgi:hypothetical protein
VYINHNKYVFNTPQEYERLDEHTILLWAIMVTLRLWAMNWTDTKVICHTNSSPVVALLSTGSSHSERHMSIARNIWLETAAHRLTLTSILTATSETQQDYIVITDSVVNRVKTVNCQL